MSDLEIDEQIEMRPKLRVLCVGCQQWVTIGECGPDNDPAVLHPLPECKLFLDTDLLTYIQTLRRHYERS